MDQITLGSTMSTGRGKYVLALSPGDIFLLCGKECPPAHWPPKRQPRDTPSRTTDRWQGAVSTGGGWARAGGLEAGSAAANAAANCALTTNSEPSTPLLACRPHRLVFSPSLRHPPQCIAAIIADMIQNVPWRGALHSRRDGRGRWAGGILAAEGTSIWSVGDAQRLMTMDDGFGERQTRLKHVVPPKVNPTVNINGKAFKLMPDPTRVPPAAPCATLHHCHRGLSALKPILKRFLALAACGMVTLVTR